MMLCRVSPRIAEWEAESWTKKCWSISTSLIVTWTLGTCSIKIFRFLYLRRNLASMVYVDRPSSLLVEIYRHEVNLKSMVYKSHNHLFLVSNLHRSFCCRSRLMGMRIVTIHYIFFFLVHFCHSYSVGCDLCRIFLLFIRMLSFSFDKIDNTFAFTSGRIAHSTCRFLL